MITSSTLYFDRLILTSLMPNVFVAVVDKPRSSGLYTASIWVGFSTDVVWLPNESTKHTSSDIEPQASFRTRMIIDDIAVRKFEGGENEFYVELSDIGLYTQMGWEMKKVDNATIFQPKKE